MLQGSLMNIQVQGRSENYTQRRSWAKNKSTLQIQIARQYRHSYSYCLPFRRTSHCCRRLPSSGPPLWGHFCLWVLDKPHTRWASLPKARHMTIAAKSGLPASFSTCSTDHLCPHAPQSLSVALTPASAPRITLSMYAPHSHYVLFALLCWEVSGPSRPKRLIWG